MEKAEFINLGFTTADAERVTLSLLKGELNISFLDWQEKKVNVLFQDTLAVKWQEADSLGPEDRDDSTFVIKKSKWLKLHSDQNIFSESEKSNFQHLKLCFNACGVLEILCDKNKIIITE
ncbi:hypothetical protein MNBD_BACTEROID06-477 [hydrothermal vent metagenome]|uniref:Uncharacterized protein n=1 Tax=hydrothermal vent metagenome TaxID=652676 RepID=A0A3B0UCL0_9ZZZZ